ncbi:MAG: response regulator [bacterium]
MAKKILVIDDEFAIAQLIKLYLEDKGYSVDTALSGTEGVKKAKEQKPDIITLDIMMPEMNGFQVMEVLKKDTDTSKIPVILISVVGGPQKERGFHLGAVDFVSKPIDEDNLFSSIRKVEEGLTRTEKTKGEILIIDDETDTANLIKLYLEDKGFKTIVALNGPDGVNLAKEKRPDLILLDLRMPGMDGFSVMKVLKMDKETEKIPVIILTGHDTKGYREKCLMLGATEYLTKPFTEDDLTKEIEERIRKVG